jgi:PTH1 family peptidyl-tRNA hydrolase
LFDSGFAGKPSGGENDVRLVVGLGNPGVEYSFTRHNAGFMVVDRFAHLFGGEFCQSGHECLLGRCRGKMEGVWCVKPLTFMNSSGRSVLAVVRELELDLSQILVVVDDFNLELGRLRVRRKGSDGGHNGLKSLDECLGTDKYPRLRFGIGSDFLGEDIIDFVLGNFTESEMPGVKAAVDKAVDLVEDWVINGLEYCQNVYNRKD